MRHYLRFPLSKGMILADEVGLGKTIEASLVIAQRWAQFTVSRETRLFFSWSSRPINRKTRQVSSSFPALSLQRNELVAIFPARRAWPE